MTNDTFSKISCLRQSARLAAAAQLVRCLDPLIDLVFPPVCTACAVAIADGNGGLQLCEACLGELSKGKSTRFCVCCGLPLSEFQVMDSTKCPTCTGHGAEPDRVVPFGIYAGELRKLVIRAKRRGERPLTASLGKLLAEKLEQESLPLDWDVAISIPKFWMKRFVRGTNSSEVLVDVIGRRLGVPTATAALTCWRNTRKQSLLRKTERQRNVRGSMRITSGYDFRGKRVLIVDDIMTTGSTAREATRVLKGGGAVSVTLAVVARAIADRAPRRIDRPRSEPM